MHQVAWRTEDQIQRIVGAPPRTALRQTRGRFGSVLSAIVFAACFGSIALVAFDKPLLAGGTLGLVLALVLTIPSPAAWVTIWLVSILDTSPGAAVDRSG